MESPVRKLRLVLGWSQVQFAQAIGRSYASVQGYEAGKRVPPEVIEKLKSIAAANNLADLALELSSDDWQVRRVFYPGEVLITQSRQLVRTDLPSSQSASAGNLVKGAGHPPPDPRQRLHRVLDEILDSADLELISAAEQALDVFARSSRRSAAPAETRKKKR